jgi:hypothetical protein
LGQNKRIVNIESWIPPSFTWASSTGIFALRVSIDDTDVVAFVATGAIEVAILRPRSLARKLNHFGKSDSLRGQLEIAAWNARELKPSGSIRDKTTVTAHCYGVFFLGAARMLVLVGRAPPKNYEGWISSELKETAFTLHQAHRERLNLFEENLRTKREANKIWIERDPRMARPLAVSDALMAIESLNPPTVCANQLIMAMPLAVVFTAHIDCQPETLNRRASEAIQSCDPSRDGSYGGISYLKLGRAGVALVHWEPYYGFPAYPEIRWAVQRRISSALRDPRVSERARPVLGSHSQPSQETLSVQGFEPDSHDLLNTLDDLPFEFEGEDLKSRVARTKKGLGEDGFDYLAWFQPFHIWSEDTWGIYFDAVRLDDFALTIREEFRIIGLKGSNSTRLAGFLAFGLVYAHEAFHAKVEAVTSWMEVNARQPRYLRYSERVYQKLRETPDWLEEALANWSSWKWFHMPEIQNEISAIAAQTDSISELVAGLLDLSPDGYRHWRKGDLPVTWRIFVTQMSLGSHKFVKPGMPVEAVFKAPLPFDFLQSDIPLRFNGRGVVADRLLSHAANLNVPSRREIERALRFYNYMVDVSGGKGSHQKWRGPDKRSFTVPVRDPISNVVFNTFLKHFEIDKETYLREVRPNL